MNRVDVRDLMEHPGASRSHRVEEPVAGLELELASVPADTPIRGQLLLESVVEGILVSGPLSGRMSLSCARCLKRYDDPFGVEVQELFTVRASAGDDEYPLDPEGTLDLEPMIRDAVMLALPFAPLCRVDCLGLCERCGGDRNVGECSCPAVVADPRWAALEGLFE